jgi:hypothetical protein
VTGILAAELQAGDVLREHDWQLHVAAVEREGACVAFTVTELGDMLMHRAAGDVLEVERPGGVR